MSDSSKSSLTQCPHCDTVFEVNDEQLQVAHGRVRCGCCQGVFDAHAHPYEQGEQADEHAVSVPQEPHANAQTWESDEPDDTPYIIAKRDDDPWATEAELPGTAAIAAPDAVESAVTDTMPDTRVEVAAVSKSGEPETCAETATEAEARTEIKTEADAATSIAETLPPIDIVDVLRDQLGDLAPPTPDASPSIIWSLLVILLVLVLGGQYVFFTRADLARDEQLRPWLQSACNYLGCELPLRHSPEQIELLSRDVISHPRIRGALLINATFVNLANYIQAYPVLQVSLSSESGTVVAMRRFQPEEYLAQGARAANGMAPGAPVRVVLEVVEPKRSAASFQFEFL